MYNPEFVTLYKALIESFNSGDIDHREFERQLATLDEKWDDTGVVEE